MAKLSAYGRTELASATTTRPVTNEPGRQVREERRFMSDGTCLKKYTWLNATGRVDHTTGWKKYGRNVMEDDFGRKALDHWCGVYQAKGWDVRRVAP